MTALATAEMPSAWRKGGKTMEKSTENELAHLLYQCNTIQGAMAYSSTGSKCLDLFFIAGAMRDHDEERINMKFVEAYRENPELAMKLLFYIRDIRGGIGERDIFRRLIRTVAKKWPESAVKNVRWITEYGRWDDLICLLGTKAEKEVVRLIREQLDADMAALERRKKGDIHAHISLCAKWMPSSNTSSARTRGNARVLMKLLKLNEKQYRAILTSLRAAISLTEHYVTRKDFGRINYDHVPSQALYRYDGLFTHYDFDRYESFMRGVRGGHRKMNAATLTPDQIVKQTYFGSDEGSDEWLGTVERLPFAYRKISDKVNISNVVSYHTHFWAKLVLYTVSRRPNSPLSIKYFQGGRQHQSRRWRAFFYNQRRIMECMPMRRFEFIGLYDEGKPRAWKHPFSPDDPGFVKADLDPYVRTGRKKYAVYRICNRFAGPRHVFNQTRYSFNRLLHIDEFWKSLTGSVGMENAISIIDTSSSMMAYDAHIVANALGLFFAEHAKGAFHNKFITFCEKPKLMKVRGNTLRQKLSNIQNADWGGTTNLEAVYRMLLRMAVRANAGQDQMPSAVVIYSDMEFNSSVTNPYGNLYDDFHEAFEQAGYKVPVVVFHNVNSLSMQTPVLSDTVGAALSSGRTTHHMKHKYTQSTTPLKHMMEVLMSERYAPIHA